MEKFLLLISISAFIVSILAFFSGFGLGTLLLPLFVLFVPIPQAIVITAFIHLLHNTFKCIALWKSIHWKTALFFGISAILSAMIGAYLLMAVIRVQPLFSYEWMGRKFEVTLIKLIIGFLLIFLAIFEWMPLSKRTLGKTKMHLVAGGLINGFLGGISGLQGAFRSVFLMLSNLGKEGFIATGAIIALFIDISRLIIYGNFINLHILFEERFAFIITAIISVFIGCTVAWLLLKKITFAFMKNIIACMLLAFGVLLSLGLLK